MNLKITIEQEEPNPIIEMLEKETISIADQMTENPDFLWNAMTHIRDEAFAFLSSGLVGLRLDGADDKECKAICALVFSVADRTETSIRKRLEETESYRIDEGDE